MLARQGTSQRMAQELMRHSDPHLTAQIYTEVSQLPTFDAVATLPWLDQKDTQIDTQNTVSKGQNLSQAVTNIRTHESSEVIEYQCFILVFSHAGTRGPMAGREGLTRCARPKGSSCGCSFRCASLPRLKPTRPDTK